MAYDSAALTADLASAKAQTTAQYGNTDINPQSIAGQPVVIQPTQTTGAAPLTLPQPTNDPSLANSAVAGANQTSKTLQDYITQLDAPKTSLDSTQQALMDRLSSLYGSDTGKAQDTASLEQSSGVNDLKKQYADLNSQILTHSAEYDKMFANLGGNGAVETSGVLAAQQSGLQRAKAADIGLLQARALGLQGQVTAAQDAVTRAINLKYQGIEEEITAKEKQMALIAPMLTQQQQKIAQAQQLMLEDQKQKIAEEKAQAKDNITLAMQAGVGTRFVNKNGEFFDVNSGVAYKTPEEFFKASGVKSFEEAYQKGLVTDINGAKLQDIGFVQQLRAKYPDAGITLSDTADEAVNKLSQSNTYFKENYMAPESNMPKPISINGQDYFQDPATGELLPASAFTGGNGAIQKPLSAEASKTLSNVQSGLDAINQMSDYLIKNGTVKSITFNPLSQTHRQYTALNNNLVDIIGRLRSGGAITADEEKRFQSLLPSALDSQATWQRKLGSVKDLLNGVQNGLLGTFNSAGNASDSTSGNQVKGIKESLSKLPLLNMDGSEKTPNVPLTKAYPQGSYPGGKPNSLANQCGYFVRSLVGKLGQTYPTVGDTLSSKIAAVRKYGSKIGNVGNVLVTDESKKTGHVAYVIGKTAKGYILAESNYHLDGKVNYGRVIPYNSPSIIGFLQPKKA